MIVVIDNYDSFTYNLVQYLGEMGNELRVFRNNRVSLEEIEALKPSQIVQSLKLDTFPNFRTTPRRDREETLTRFQA